MPNRIALFAALLAASTLGASAARAHNAEFPIPGKKILLKTDATRPEKAKFVFKSDKSVNIVPLHDPRTDGATMLLRGTGPDAGRTVFITLDPTKWQALGTPAGSRGYKYKDKDGVQGGIKKVVWQPGKLGISGGGVHWTWAPSGAQASMQVFFFVGNEQYCAEFAAYFSHDEAGFVQAKDGLAPVACAASVCGNAELEAGENCDDGDLVDDNACSNDCQTVGCSGVHYDSTWQAIQQQILVGHACANALCHSGAAPAGGLDLTTANAYAALVNVPSTVSPHQRVTPGDHSISFLWEKLAAATLAPNGPVVPGTPMPAGGGAALTADELEAVKLWIRNGAPQTGVVEGTADLLASCLPDATPQKIPPLDLPAAGTGVQLYSPPWPLPANTEHEVCSATYFDYTGQIDPQFLAPCPSYLGGSGETCFRYHRRLLAQDPQSHHSIIHMYRGAYAWNDPSWGAWTCQGGANAGMACNPTVVGVAAPAGADCGTRSACGTTARDALACIGYGPPDNGFNSNVSPQFAGAQEARQDLEFADGVYSMLPIKGLVVWNSHAFNLTEHDTTMEQYLNLYFANPPDQIYSLQGIFDDTEIFTQNVPAFEQREYCRTFTLPANSRLFELSSHVHKRGKLFRIWGPPHASSCTAAGGCLPDAGTPMYVSTEYNDPVQNIYDPPISYAGATAANRRFKFCALYDNGFTDFTKVKRRSTSPPAPLGIGGPCALSATSCYGGPHQGTLCNGDNAVCDSTPGGGDGVCDACPLIGGVTTEDEMFIMLGSYFIAP